MAVSRLFVEIGDGVDRLNASLRRSIETAEKAGISVQASGQRMLAAFDKALNPTKDLAEQIKLLEKAGKSGADIWKVYGDRLTVAAEAAKKNGQAVDATVAKLIEENKATSAGKVNFENLGRSIQDFARNPMQAAQNGINSLVGSLGPMAVGILSVATAAGVAAKAIFDMGAAAVEEAEGLHNLSISTGLTTQQLQALKQIGKEAGLEGLDLGRTIGMLNKQLGSKEGGDFTRALVEADIALQDTSGNSKDVIVLLDELRGKFSGIVDPVARANAMHAALGGRLRELIPLLMSSNDSLAAQIKVMEETGPVWDDITQQKLMQFESALDSIGRVWASLVTDIKAGVGSILGSVGNLSNLPSLATAGLDKLTPEQRVKMNLAAQPSSAKLTFPEGPLTSVDVESFKQSEKISRDLFDAQQKLIAQGADFINVRMDIAAAEQKFQQAISKGTRDEVAAQALAMAALNQRLKELQQARKESEEAAKKHAVALAKEEQEVRDANRRLLERSMVSSTALIDNAKQIDERNKGQLSLDAPKSDMRGVMDSVDQVAKAFEKYRENIRNMQEDVKQWTMTAQEEQLAALQEYYDEVETLRQLDLISEQEAADAKKRIEAEQIAVKLSQAQTFFDTMASLQGSHLRAVAAIGKAAAIAEATINTYVGATLALRQGGIWGALQMGAVLAAGFAQVYEIAAQGFKGGGYTGGVSRDAVAGVVHGQEYVMNADATAQYKPLLDMLNSGRGVGSQMDSGPGMSVWGRPTMNVQIANYGTGKTFDVEHVDENTVRVIARDEAYSVLSRRGPEVIAADLAYPNSRTSKAISKHTTARRGDR